MKKILTVDDSVVIRKIVANAIALIGVETLDAENGEKALAVLEEKSDDISLILLDWNMPGMNGLEVLHKIKADARWRSIPVMMVTTEAERENVIKAIEGGASSYLSKPFAQEDLVTKVMESLGGEL